MSHQVERGTASAAAAGTQPAQQEEPTVFVPQTPGAPVIYPEAFHGRKISWVAVAVVALGFLCGGLALIVGPTWWAFWLGVAIAVVGFLIATAANVFDDWY